MGTKIVIKSTTGFVPKNEFMHASSGKSILRNIELMDIAWDDVCFKAMFRGEWKVDCPMC